MYPRTLPDLFAEDELLVTGRLRGTGTAKFIIKGKLGGKPVTYTRTVDLGKAPRAPVGRRLWAQARVDHLLEEIALGDDRAELKNEVLELALAYNFVTPYTAFLAIPESELGNMKQTLDNARAEKQKIMDKNADAADLRDGTPRTNAGHVASARPMMIARRKDVTMTMRDIRADEMDRRSSRDGRRSSRPARSSAKAARAARPAAARRLALVLVSRSARCVYSEHRADADASR